MTQKTKMQNFSFKRVSAAILGIIALGIIVAYVMGGQYVWSDQDELEIERTPNGVIVAPVMYAGTCKYIGFFAPRYDIRIELNSICSNF
jgi:hypothetical protein